MDRLATLKICVSRQDLRAGTYFPGYEVLEGKEEKPYRNVVYEILHNRLMEGDSNGITEGGCILPVQLGQPAPGERGGTGACDPGDTVTGTGLCCSGHTRMRP